MAPTSSSASGVWLINEVAENLGAGTWTSAPINMEFISKIVMDGTSNTVSFTSVPQQYRHLRLIGANLVRASNSNGGMGFKFNNDATTTNYGFTRMWNNGVSGGANGYKGSGFASSLDNFPGYTSDSNDSSFIWDISNYSDASVGTTCSVLWGRDEYMNSGQQGTGGSNYQVASAVTQLDLLSTYTTSGYYFQAPGTFNLFGIGKAA